ncbi:hypothetical protein HMPREF9123_1979 [Neisseria bacilliformis ATCC BAA-1200]|uniref:Uncharacterized protein n=1 Tax=Neisseria bacilliformis ATCC BAA-1200 TaxID=888742 RepID=F2BE23_9NEIS|nr:hypothetical protein HMPREF9123_1979 [Neisseria bacilliformis ATCC BAA-1200]
MAAAETAKRIFRRPQTPKADHMTATASFLLFAALLLLSIV